MRREFIPDDFDEEPNKEVSQAPPPEEKPLWQLVDEQIRIQGLDKSFEELTDHKSGGQGEEPDFEDYQAGPPEPKPSGMSLEAYRRFQAQGENLAERVAARYQQNVARRQAREAQAALAPTSPPPVSEKLKRKPASNRRTHANSPSNSPTPTGPSRGVFLLHLKHKEVTWRLQLFAFERKDGVKNPMLRFHPWESGEGGHPISGGPHCGFSLSVKDAKSLLAALQKGLEMVRSGEFDPNDEQNCLPRRK